MNKMDYYHTDPKRLHLSLLSEESARSTCREGSDARGKVELERVEAKCVCVCVLTASPGLPAYLSVK